VGVLVHAHSPLITIDPGRIYTVQFHEKNRTMRILEELAVVDEMIALLHDQPFDVSGKELARDIRTLIRRSQNEGFNFLTKVLPQIGKLLDKALSGNESFCVSSYLRTNHDTCIPRFLGSAIRRVFDDAGNLLQEPCYSTVRWLRTFLFYAYKIEIPFTEAQTNRYCDQFKATDDEIGDSPNFTSEATVRLRNLMRSQLHSILDGCTAGNPSFGPGKSSNTTRHGKYSLYVPPSPMRAHFGRNFFHQSSEYWVYELCLLWLSSYLVAFLGIEPAIAGRLFYDGFSEESEVLFVPKDSRGPRVICCEPSHKMYAQKALQRVIYNAVEAHPRTQGRVNFTDQSINQKLTFDSGNATIDLKDASDRVSLNLVIDVFPQPLVNQFIHARTAYATLPDGSKIRLEKFAPMGNALCFPVMALCAYTAITAAIYLAGGPLPIHNEEVFVYGDDIIIRNEWAEVAMSALEAIELRVNRGKSFIYSRFRESCGQDTLDNSTVTPLRRRRLNNGIKVEKVMGQRVLDDGNGYIAHTVSLMNQAYHCGFNHLGRRLQESVESTLKSKLPYGTSESGYLCVIVSSSEEAWRYNQVDNLESKNQIRAFTVRDREHKFRITPYGRLRRNLLEGGGLEPITADKIGARSPYLLQKTFQKWYVGAYAPARR